MSLLACILAPLAVLTPVLFAGPQPSRHRAAPAGTQAARPKGKPEALASSGKKRLLRPSRTAQAAQKPRRAVILSLRVEPADIPLIGTRAEGRVVVTARMADGAVEDVSRMAALTSADPKIARVGADRILRPVTDGETVLTVSYAGKTARVPVRVKEAKTRVPVEFTREIIPILTRAGCNQGSCHGSQYGKGGFKLSLAGFDPDLDYFTIIKQAGGRRALTVDPTRSLILLKSTLTLPHQGGKRLEVGSPDYNRIVAWLQGGAPGPQPDDPEVTKIEVFPAGRQMTVGKEQSLVVRATYSDGVVRDVTPWARFNTLNEAIAAVSPDAVVKAVGRGETSVMVRFGGQATVARITIPFAQIAKYPALPENNFVDKFVARKWKSLGLLPSGLCDDATFLRRVYFDVIGTPPPPEEVKAFLKDRSPDKRARLIDRVLDRSEYADYWTLKWGDLLRSERTRLGPKGMWSLTNWIRAQFRDNRPADQFVRDLITAQGSTFTNGPANYYRVASDPPNLAETTSQVFLGIRLQCAKCHHHPYEKWSQADYYQLAAFFARIGLKGSQEFGIFGNEQVVHIRKDGEVYHPKTGGVMKPTPLGGYPAAMRARGPQTADLTDPDPDANGDRRALLADWITKDNILFARNIVNRYWGYLMGRGLVEPIDDQRVTNPPTNPELLDALAKDFMAHNYDLKHLIRTICNSRAYQLSSDAAKDNRNDTTFYTHYLIRRLPAEVLLDAINIATGTKEKFPELPLGYRAIQLPDPQIASRFLDLFGRAPRVIACECERAAEPNMTQALHLLMGDLINRKIQDGSGLLAKLVAAQKSNQEIIETLYLTALGRPPRHDEAAKAQKAIADLCDRLAVLPPKPLWGLPRIRLPRTQEARDRDRKMVLEDILWALLNSKEFVFNH